MSGNEHTVPVFEQPGVPFAYDLLFRAMYLPVGGEAALRRAAVERLGLRGNERVLELGCGTGSFTRLLLAAGARVHAVDGSLRMLARAVSKAPGASYAQVDLRAFVAPPERTFDVVFMAFVLHELEEPMRRALFEQVARCLAPGGRVAVVDHAVPEGGGFARGWRRFLATLEPASVRDVLSRGYETELREAGFDVVERTPIARGTAHCLIARAHAPGPHAS